MDENLEWLTQNTEDPKSNKGNLAPFTEELQMIQVCHQKTYRNIFLQLLISLRAFKLTSITT